MKYDIEIRFPTQKNAKKKKLKIKRNFDAEGKFDARWDDKLKFFFKGPYLFDGFSQKLQGQFF